MLSEGQTANSEYVNEYLASKTKINNTGIFCCYFSISFHSANPNFGLRPKLGSLWTERKTNPKSEIAQCQAATIILPFATYVLFNRSASAVVLAEDADQ